MGQMGHSSGSTESVRSEINRIEDNSQKGDAPLKQSLTQNVTNSKVSGNGEFKAPGAHHGPKQ